MGCGNSTTQVQKASGETSSDAKPTKQDKEAAKTANKTFEESMKFLAQVPLFKRLPKSEHPQTAMAMGLKHWKVGDNVIKQGEMGDEFFVIFKGSAQVFVQQDGAEEKVVANLKVGDYFGEGSLLSEEPRKATIKASEQLETLSITREKFQELGLHDKIQFAKRKAVLAAVDEEAEIEPNGPTDKTPEEEKLIASAIKSNQNLNALVTMDDERVKALVACAWKQNVPRGEEIIKEGDAFADYFYVVQEGTFEVLQSQSEGQSAESHTHNQGDVQSLAVVKAGSSFGELALLYYAPRAATVKASTNSVVWVIHRQQFKAILMKASDTKIDEYSKILDGVALLDGLLSDEKRAIAEALAEMHFTKDEVILSQGEMGSTFFILYDGEVACIKDGVETGHLKADKQNVKFFGERALLKNEPRNATVKVVSKAARALALDRDSFEMLLGPLEEILGENKKAAGNANTRKSMAANKNTLKARMSVFPQEAKAAASGQKIQRSDLKRLGLLGCGGFGMVTLEENKVTGQTYAMKALSKGYIVKTGMQASVMNEKMILSMTDSVFVIKLYETYRGSQSLYFLLEPALGGELYATYHRKGLHGSEKHAKFYTSAVIMAFQHLHERRVIYRDLKPENVLLDKDGFAKLTDMGLAKFVVGKTYTTCGTPDYFAPEVISSVGHNVSVDWWTLGILVFELMTGHPPFESSDPMQTYMKVMQGIDKVKFSKGVQGEIEDLVKNLLKQEPSERLPMRKGGVDNLKSHSWFQSVDFDALENKSIEPPYKPKVKSATDLANFSAREEDAPRQIKYVDDGSGWDADF